MIDSGNYEEMLVIKQPNITLKNASTSPNTNLIDKGVNIANGAVRVTSYYGVGYNYYSMSNDQKWHQDVLDVNRENGSISYQNVSGTTNGSYWNATVVVNANGFQADDIIFENSFNQYISSKESQDVLVMWTTGSPGLRPTLTGDTGVQSRTLVERAAAIAVPNNIDKVILNKCRVVGRQDSFFGGAGARVVVYKGDMMGAVDYIFGGMNAVFYKSNLSMNVSDASNDQSYITAAQQSSGRGFLMYECTVTSAIPQIESASVYRAKPGYFGRPWSATTSEVVFYNTTIETSNNPSFNNQSLIMPLGWQNTLGGNSSGMYEFATIENSGINNTPNRATWATSLSSPILNDGTAITTFNFTKGSDNWDPIPQLITNEALVNNQFLANTSVNVQAFKNNVVVSNITSNTKVTVYSINGSVVKTFETNTDTNFNLGVGFWIVTVKDADGQKAFKIIAN
jgi:exo-poly-alpha-galacturonosidase